MSGIKELTVPCGLYCRICPMHRAGEDRKLGLERWMEEAPDIQRRYFRGKKDFVDSELKLEG